MNINHYTYRITWSAEDQQHVGLCAEFPSLSWLADDIPSALQGIMQVVAEVVDDMRQHGEKIPQPLSEKKYSGEFRVRIPALVHRTLVLEAAEQGISMNRLVSAKLAAN